MRIGIYGGSFNPIHRGHTELAASIVAQGLVDELWLMVSPLNPLKSGEMSDIAEYGHRLRMAELATEDVVGVRVSDFERSLPLPSYTITTLDELGKAFPEHEFTLVIGADNWERFPHWYKYEEILAHHHVIVYPRTGCELKDIPDGITIANTPLIDISSTEIREKISTPTYNGEGLHPAVWEEIKRKKYYTGYED